MILAEVLVICYKTEDLVNVKEKCFSCKAELLQGVSLKSINHKNYEIKVDCNGTTQTPKIFFMCPQSNTRTPLDVCLKSAGTGLVCSGFRGIVFYGQQLHLICTEEENRREPDKSKWGKGNIDGMGYKIPESKGGCPCH
jgi:hypothetical protein